MAVTAASFLTNFPEFNDCEPVPQSEIDFWIDFASYMLRESIWGASSLEGEKYLLRDYGILFFVAHNLAVGRYSGMASSSGGNGGVQGLVSSKSVDKVSLSYDTGATMQPGAGHWNSTSYGQRFARMLKMIGSRPIYVGGIGPQGTSAWYGPMPYVGYASW